MKAAKENSERYDARCNNTGRLNKVQGYKIIKFGAGISPGLRDALIELWEIPWQPGRESTGRPIKEAIIPRRKRNHKLMRL